MTRAEFTRRQVNLSGHASNPRVTVTFSDEKTFTRELELNGDGEPVGMHPEAPHKLFKGSGFVLRRQDIISFLRASPGQRYPIFASFMKGVASNVLGLSVEAEQRLEEAAAEKVERVEIREREIGELASLLQMNPDRLAAHVLDAGTFRMWVTANGLSRAQTRHKTARRANYRAIAAQVEVVRKSIEEYVKASQELARLRKIASVTPLGNVLREVSETLSESFLEISPQAQSVAKVELHLSSDATEIDLFATLANGVRVKAEGYFSEANLDLLALLLFLSLLKFAGQHGQAKFMALDDVLQSVDSPVRVKVAQFLVREFANWQLLITFHDRLWKEQFGAILSPGQPFVEREIKAWSLDSGPHLVQLRRNASSDLRESLALGGTRSICGDAGYLLEVMSDWLSKSLQTSVTRRHGDKYTLGDTWPSVASSLKKTVATSLVENVEKYSWLRNAHGAHYNEWAESLSIEDARAFGSATIALWDAVWCEKCREPAGKHGDLIHCRCGLVSLPKKVKNSQSADDASGRQPGSD